MDDNQVASAYHGQGNPFVELEACSNTLTQTMNNLFDGYMVYTGTPPTMAVLYSYAVSFKEGLKCLQKLFTKSAKMFGLKDGYHRLNIAGECANDARPFALSFVCLRDDVDTYFNLTNDLVLQMARDEVAVEQVSANLSFMAKSIEEQIASLIVPGENNEYYVVSRREGTYPYTYANYFYPEEGNPCATKKREAPPTAYFQCLAAAELYRSNLCLYYGQFGVTTTGSYWKPYPTCFAVSLRKWDRVIGSIFLYTGFSFFSTPVEEFLAPGIPSECAKTIKDLLYFMRVYGMSELMGKAQAEGGDAYANMRNEVSGCSLGITTAKRYRHAVWVEAKNTEELPVSKESLEVMMDHVEAYTSMLNLPGSFHVDSDPEATVHTYYGFTYSCYKVASNLQWLYYHL